MVCLTSCVGAILMKNVGMSTGLAILIMFAIGLAVGAVNGFMVSYVGVPAMIATLGTQYICYGLAKLLTRLCRLPTCPIVSRSLAAAISSAAYSRSACC